MSGIVCGKCGTRLDVRGAGETVRCPRCGAGLAAGNRDRIIRVRHNVPVLKYVITVALLGGVAAAAWYGYGAVRRAMEESKQQEQTRKGLPELATGGAPPVPNPSTAPASSPRLPADPVVALPELDEFRASAPVEVKSLGDAEFAALLDRVADTTDAALARIRRLLMSLGEPDQPDYAQRVRTAIRDRTLAVYDPEQNAIGVRSGFDPTVAWRLSPDARSIGRRAMLLRAAQHAELAREGRRPARIREDDDLDLAVRTELESSATRALAPLAARPWTARSDTLLPLLIREHQLPRGTPTVEEAISQAELQSSEIAAGAGDGLSGFAIARHFRPRSRLVDRSVLKRVTIRFRDPAALLPGWRFIDENTLGIHGFAELGRLMLSRIGVLRPEEWAGDRWALFERDGKTALVLYVLSQSRRRVPYFSGHAESPPGVAYGRVSVNVFGLPEAEAMTVAMRAFRQASHLESEKLDEILAFLRRTDPPPLDASAQERFLRSVEETLEMPPALLYACIAYPDRALAWLEAFFTDKKPFLEFLTEEEARRFEPVMRDAEPRASARLKSLIRRVRDKFKLGR